MGKVGGHRSVPSQVAGGGSDPRTLKRLLPVRAQVPSTGMRERIIAAGFQVLLQLGENKASMNEIANAAGVSRGTVYRYFGNRDRLVDAVIEHSTHVYWDAIDARLVDSMSLGDKIEARVRTSIRFSKGLGDRLASGSVDLYRRLFSADSGRTVKLSVERTIPILEIARERGELRDDLDIQATAEWITRIVLSLIWLPVSSVVDLTDEEAGAKYVREMIMRGIGSEGTE